MCGSAFKRELVSSRAVRTEGWMSWSNTSEFWELDSLLPGERLPELSGCGETCGPTFRRETCGSTYRRDLITSRTVQLEWHFWKRELMTSLTVQLEWHFWKLDNLLLKERVPELTSRTVQLELHFWKLDNLLPKKRVPELSGCQSAWGPGEGLDERELNLSQTDVMCCGPEHRQETLKMNIIKFYFWQLFFIKYF